MKSRVSYPAVLLAAALLFCASFVAFARSADAALTLTVNSEYGHPDPSGSVDYLFGSSVTATVDQMIIVDVDTRIVCTGWLGTGSTSPATGTTNTVTFIIYINSTITWQWSYEYTLKIYNPLSDIGSSSPPVGTYRFFAGTTVNGTIPNFVQGYVAGGYTGTGSAAASSDTPYFSFVINQPSTVTWRWNSISEVSVTRWGKPSANLTIYGDTKYSVLLYDPISATPRIFYYEPLQGDLIVAYYNGLVWNNITIDASGNVGKYIKALVNPDGVYSVAYFDETNGMLKYAVSSDGFQWQIENVDPYNRAGSGLDMTYDGAGNPAIAYFAPGLNALRLVRRSGGLWGSPEVVETNVSDSVFVSLAYNPVSTGFDIAYYDGISQRGRHAFKIDTTWNVEEIAAQNNSGLYMACAVSATGQPFFAYQEYAQAGRKDLKLTYKSAGNWYYKILSTTGDTGYFNLLSFEAHGFPVVVTLDNTQAKIRQYSWNGLTWVVMDVADDTSFYQFGQTTDADGPVIYYFSTDTLVVRKPSTEDGGGSSGGDTELTGGGGCFVATAAFGSMAAAEVCALAAFRDSALASSSLGGACVALYYFVSPGLAERLEQRCALRAFARELLGR
ncbi:MAG: CFI-box-CTERM domain-containing protein [Candidatus Brocadiia bacterium]